MPTITAHPGDVPVLEPTATGGRSRRAAAAAVGVATAASVLAAGAPAHAETYYTGGCTVYSQVNGSAYPRAFQARIVGSIEQGTGKYIWDHYDYSYVIDPHLTFGGSSDEVVTVTSGYDSGLTNPWSSPDNHGSNGGFLTEANWKGVKSYWGFTKVKFHAAFDVPGTPDPHCDASTGTV